MSVNPVGLVAVAALCGSSACLADVIDLSAVADNTLYETVAGSSSNGRGGSMFVGRNAGSTNSKRRGVLRFDLSSIPEGATVTGVTLTLNQTAVNSGSAIVHMHALSQAWGEGSSSSGTSGGGGGGVPAAEGDATWLHTSFNTALWNTPGGDFSALSSASTEVIGPGFYTWSSEGLVSDVTAFLADPGLNFGWILIGDESVPSSAKRFDTREALSDGTNPRLTVTFQIPSPGAGMLVGIGGAMALRRRRR
ncbi:MAG: DNRLRE domain-containing protein [Phycisphaerales bacterium]